MLSPGALSDACDGCSGPFNPPVQGSSPWWLTIRSRPVDVSEEERQALIGVRTLPQGGPRRGRPVRPPGFLACGRPVCAGACRRRDRPVGRLHGTRGEGCDRGGRPRVGGRRVVVVAAARPGGGGRGLGRRLGHLPLPGGSQWRPRAEAPGVHHPDRVPLHRPAAALRQGDADQTGSGGQRRSRPRSAASARKSRPWKSPELRQARMYSKYATGPSGNPALFSSPRRPAG